MDEAPQREAVFWNENGCVFLRDTRCSNIPSMIRVRARVGGSGPSIVPASRYSANKIVWHSWELPVVVAVCGEAPAAAVVPVFPSIVHKHAL